MISEIISPEVPFDGFLRSMARSSALVTPELPVGAAAVGVGVGVGVGFGVGFGVGVGVGEGVGEGEGVAVTAGACVGASVAGTYCVGASVFDCSYGVAVAGTSVFPLPVTSGASVALPHSVSSAGSVAAITSCVGSGSTLDLSIPDLTIMTTKRMIAAAIRKTIAVFKIFGCLRELPISFFLRCVYNALIIAETRRVFHCFINF